MVYNNRMKYKIDALGNNTSLRLNVIYCGVAIQAVISIVLMAIAIRSNTRYYIRISPELWFPAINICQLFYALMHTNTQTIHNCTSMHVHTYSLTAQTNKYPHNICYTSINSWQGSSITHCKCPHHKIWFQILRTPLSCKWHRHVTSSPPPPPPLQNRNWNYYYQVVRNIMDLREHVLYVYCVL